MSKDLAREVSSGMFVDTPSSNKSALDMAVNLPPTWRITLVDSAPY